MSNIPKMGQLPTPGLGLGMDWDAENGRFKRSDTSSGFSAHCFVGLYELGGSVFGCS
jgi:hypothetical protein